MIIEELINEAINYLDKDCEYAVIIGAVKYGDINPNDFEKKEVKGQTFDHVYISSFPVDEEGENRYGQCLIPYSHFGYFICEWAT